MTTPIRARRVWSNRLAKLSAERKAAEENVLVAVFLARLDGIPNQVIADAIGGLSPSGVAAKARKGEAIIKARKGSSRP